MLSSPRLRFSQCNFASSLVHPYRRILPSLGTLPRTVRNRCTHRGELLIGLQFHRYSQPDRPSHTTYLLLQYKVRRLRKAIFQWLHLNFDSEMVEVAIYLAQTAKNQREMA